MFGVLVSRLLNERKDAVLLFFRVPKKHDLKALPGEAERNFGLVAGKFLEDEFVVEIAFLVVFQ